MAQKTDIAAAKARKQKIVLVVAGVALVGLAAIQLPKLTTSDSPPAAVPAAASADTAAGSVPSTGVVAAPATPVAGSGTVAGARRPAAYVAGVALPGSPVVRPATGQLASFTLFETRDPFVQQVGDTAADGQAGVEVAPGAGSPVPADVAPASPADSDSAVPGDTGAVAGSDTATAGDVPEVPAAKPLPIAYATIMLDGKPQQLQLKAGERRFPKSQPLFVLVALTKKQAKIGVVGGSFENGGTVALSLGKRLTLLNTATGVRYALELQYTGSEPETIEGFSTAATAQPEAPAQPAAPAGGTVEVTSP